MAPTRIESLPDLISRLVSNTPSSVNNTEGGNLLSTEGGSGATSGTDLDPQSTQDTFIDTAAMYYWLGMLLWIPAFYVGYRVCRTLSALVRAVFVFWIAPIFYSPNLRKYEHRWTVVTGGTDGIGRAYVVELAKRGLRKFVLIGRSQEKLKHVKDFLELSYDCRVRTFLFDFETGDYEKLRAFIDEIDVGFVVNSVGVGRENLERYGDNPKADRLILRVNAVGSAEFLSLVLPAMERNGGGQIVVLSSSQGYRPIPLLAAYCASKAVMSFLSECIDREYKTIHVQYLTPALVATKMVYYSKGGLFVVTPENFAHQAVSTVGLVKVTAGCFNHEIQLLARHLIPWCLLKHLIMPIYYFQRRRMLRYHATHAMEKSQPQSNPILGRATA